MPKRLTALIFILSLLLLLMTVSIAAAQVNSRQRVIVQLKTHYVQESALDVYAIQSQRANLRAVQSDVLARLGRTHNVTRYQTLPYIALEVDAAGLARLQSDPDVNAIFPDKQYFLSATDADAHNAFIGSPTAWSLGYTGQNTVVAVLDAGFDFTHPALNGKAVAEACFTTTSTAANSFSTCPNGEDVQIGVGASFPSGFLSPSDRADHGQHVAGTIAGNDGSTGGFRGNAPGAKLIGVNVFARINSNVVAFDSDIISGLEWVYSQRDLYNVVAVNMSLGGGNYTTAAACDADNIPLRDAIISLTETGIAVIAASGNSGQSGSLNAPACISEVISVGSVEVAATNGGLVDDRVSDFSNSTDFLDLLAPGDLIYSSVFNNQYNYKKGTSMAAPHASGAWAVLSQAYPNATIAEILDALKTTGVPVTDSRNNITTPRIQVDAALGLDASPVTPISPINTPTLSHFEWSRSPYANGYRLHITRNSNVVFDNVVHPSCDTSTCAYSLSSPLLDGTNYTWTVASVNALGVESTVSSTVSFAIGATTSSVPADLAVFGLTTTTPVRPTFFWTHSPNSATTAVPGDWYNLNIVQGATTILDHWYPVQQICTNVRCEATPSRDEFLIGLPSGTVTWRVRAWTPSSGIGNWSESKTLTVDYPDAEIPANITVDGSSGRPVIHWDHDPSATWFNLWVGSSDASETLDFSWYEKTPGTCSALTCTLVPNAHPLKNGTYVVWMRSWGPTGNYSSGGDNAGWSGPHAFTVNNAVPDVPTAFTATNANSGRPTFSWSGVDAATWYQVRIEDADNNSILSEWRSAYDLDCAAGEICRVTPNAVLTNGETFNWKVQAWGPGGFNNNDQNAFATGGFFTVTSAFAGVPLPLTPTGTITNPNPTYNWLNVQDGSWYQLQVFNAGSSTPLHEHWYSLEQLGCHLDETCHTQINTYLANGSYEWRVQAYTPAGLGIFSERENFTVTERP